MRAFKPIPADIAQRGHDEYYMELDNGCRPSMGTKNATNGYAYFGGYLAHRAAWVHANGPIPDGETVDHMCKTRTCVNPAHLRLLSLSHNSARHHGRDWTLGKCAWGHDESEMKLYHWSGIDRMACAACLKDRNDAGVAVNTALYSLELAYGLGGHEAKRNYSFKMRERDARVAAVASARMGEAA